MLKVGNEERQRKPTHIRVSPDGVLQEILNHVFVFLCIFQYSLMP